MRINGSESPYPRLRTTMSAADAKRWLIQNWAATAAYNQRVASHGLLADEVALLDTAATQLDRRPR